MSLQSPRLFYLDEVPKRAFVMGLSWQPLAGVSASDRKKEIQMLAKELSFTLHVVRHSETPCVGFARADDTIKAGCITAAGIISKTIATENNDRDYNFIFVAPLPDGQWACIIQREGMILPDGDLIFDSEDAARAHVLQNLSIGDWRNLYLPEIWGIPNSTERSLASMLPRRKNGTARIHRWWGLVPTASSARLFALHGKKLALVAILLLIAGGLWVAYQSYKNALHLEKIAQEAARLAQMQKENAPPPPPPPWKSQPMALDMMSNCMSVLEKQKLFPGNWELKEVTCNGQAVKISWVPKAWGWVAHLNQIEPRADIALDGNSATLIIAIAPMAPGQEDTLLTERERVFDMRATAQRLGLKLAITHSTPPTAPVLPGQTPAAPVEKPRWKAFQWKLEELSLPVAAISELEDIGMRIQQINAVWQAGKFIWTIEGVQYVQS
jgi:hypothetical protein